jgi:hypothetical protein
VSRTDVTSIQKYFVHHVEYTLAQTRQNLDKTSTFQALALSVRDRLVERWKVRLRRVGAGPVPRARS